MLEIWHEQGKIKSIVWVRGFILIHLTQANQWTPLGETKCLWRQNSKAKIGLWSWTQNGWRGYQANHSNSWVMFSLIWAVTTRMVDYFDTHDFTSKPSLPVFSHVVLKLPLAIYSFGGCSVFLIKSKYVSPTSLSSSSAAEPSCSQSTEVISAGGIPAATTNFALRSLWAIFYRWRKCRTIGRLSWWAHPLRHGTR